MRNRHLTMCFGLFMTGQMGIGIPSFVPQGSRTNFACNFFTNNSYMIVVSKSRNEQYVNISINLLLNQVKPGRSNLVGVTSRLVLPWHGGGGAQAQAKPWQNKGSARGPGVGPLAPLL